VTQSAPITVANLLANTGGSVTLTDSGNAIGTIAVSASSLDLASASSVNIGSLSRSSVALGTIIGVQVDTTAHITSAGGISVGSPITTFQPAATVALKANGGNIDLSSSIGPGGSTNPLSSLGLYATGSISQTSAGVITADTLGIYGGAAVTLTAANQVGVLAASYGSAPSPTPFTFVNSKALTIGSYTGLDFSATGID